VHVLYRDARVVAVSKPAGYVVHKSSMTRERVVMLQAVRDALGQHVWPVHRLDRGTSGVLLFALDADAARHIHGSFERGLVKKTYRALVRGNFGAIAGTDAVRVDYAIPKDEDGPKVSAQTTFFLEEAFAWCSLIRALPQTGRFHQIRRHLSHLRYPIANDTNYGTGWFNRKVREDLGLLRMALHAEAITLPHPDAADADTADADTARMLHVTDDMHPDFSEALRRLRTT